MSSRSSTRPPDAGRLLQRRGQMRARPTANKQKSRHAQQQQQLQQQQRQHLTALHTPIAAAIEPPAAHVRQLVQMTTEKQQLQQQQQPVSGAQDELEAAAAAAQSIAAVIPSASPPTPLTQPPRRETPRLQHVGTQQRLAACQVEAQPGQAGQLQQQQQSQLQLQLAAHAERLAARSEARQLIVNLTAGVAACAAVKCGLIKPRQLRDSNLKGFEQEALWTLPSHVDADDPEGSAVARLLEQLATVRSQLRHDSNSRNPVALIRIEISDEHPTHALQREVRVSLRQGKTRPLTAQCNTEIQQLVAILLQVKRECGRSADAIPHGSPSISIRALRQKEAQAIEGSSICSSACIAELGQLSAGHFIADVRYHAYPRVDMPPLPPSPSSAGLHKPARAAAPVAVAKNTNGDGDKMHCCSSSPTVKVEEAGEIAAVQMLATCHKRGADLDAVALHKLGAAAGDQKRAKVDRR